MSSEGVGKGGVNLSFEPASRPLGRSGATSGKLRINVEDPDVIVAAIAQLQAAEADVLVMAQKAIENVISLTLKPALQSVLADAIGDASDLVKSLDGWTISATFTLHRPE